jgi:hypothetical protein
MDVLKTKAKLKALKLISLKYGKIEDIQAQEVDKVFSLNLEYRYAVLSEDHVWFEDRWMVASRCDE